jgi:hypothetical protein
MWVASAAAWAEIKEAGQRGPEIGGGCAIFIDKFPVGALGFPGQQRLERRMPVAHAQVQMYARKDQSRGLGSETTFDAKVFPIR